MSQLEQNLEDGSTPKKRARSGPGPQPEKAETSFPDRQPPRTFQYHLISTPHVAEFSSGLTDEAVARFNHRKYRPAVQNV